MCLNGPEQTELVSMSWRNCTSSVLGSLIRVPTLNSKVDVAFCRIVTADSLAVYESQVIA